MSIVIGTKFHMKLYITKYICANFHAIVINIFLDFYFLNRYNFLLF